MNADGRQDIITADYNSNTVSILHNNKTNNLQLGMGDDSIHVGISQILVSGGVGTDTLSVDYSASSSGVSYQLSGTTTLDTRSSYNEIEAALAGATAFRMQTSNGLAHAGSDTISVLYGQGDGTFRSRITDVVEDSPNSVTIADLNGDGYQDIVTADAGYYANRNNDVVSVVLNKFSAANNMIHSGAGKDSISTGNGNDTLDGGTGPDSMSGGAGNDLYIVDDIGDMVNGGEGIDTIQASVTFILRDDVENLTLTGKAVINGTGNGLANILTGNGAANILDGGTEKDTLRGGAGSDTYVVDNDGDIVIEGADNKESLDIVKSSVTFALKKNVEYLILTGTASFTTAGQIKFVDGVLYGNTDADLEAEFAIALTGVSVLAMDDLII